VTVTAVTPGEQLICAICITTGPFRSGVLTVAFPEVVGVTRESPKPAGGAGPGERDDHSRKPPAVVLPRA
jgi:hypothetical protein